MSAPQPNPAPLPVPQRRKPLRYKRPGTSWVTFVILGFAAVGMAAVGGTAVKKLLKTAMPAVTQPAPARPVTYAALAKDDAVLVRVQVWPRDARVLLDGEPAVSNPLRILRGKTQHRLSASAPGYQSAMQDFTAEAGRTVRLLLKKQP
jgi:hypothetical protein